MKILHTTLNRLSAYLTGTPSAGTLTIVSLAIFVCLESLIKINETYNKKRCIKQRKKRNILLSRRFNLENFSLFRLAGVEDETDIE